VLETSAAYPTATRLLAELAVKADVPIATTLDVLAASLA